MSGCLLDTCAVIWKANNDLLREPGASELRDLHSRNSPIYVSPITAWEIATLASNGKMTLALRPDIWFQIFCNLPRIALAQMPPEVLVASTYLPGNPPKDPADRILVATAREYGYKLISRDLLLLEYGKSGHVQVLEC